MRIFCIIIFLLFMAFFLFGCIHNGIIVTPTTPTEPDAAKLYTEPTSQWSETSSATHPESTVPDSDTIRPDPYDVDTFELLDTEQAFLGKIHAMRAAKALSPLATDEALCALAYIRAYEAAKSFGHSRPDGDGYTTVFTDFGYVFTASEELLLRTDPSTSMDEMLSVWLENDPTGDKIISPNFQYVGVGIYYTDGYVFVACLLTAK